jgi:transketolase
MRNRFADVFYELGKHDPRLCILVADISPAGSIEKFRKNFPNRFVNTGVAEQVMIGMAAGMAQRGLRPFVYTIATFALYRPFEFIRNDICYQDLPVTIVGIGGGLSYSTLGATHHAQEDIAVASTLPGMRIITPSDPAEVEAATRWCATQNSGPVYLRLGKAGEPDITTSLEDDWEFGKLRTLRIGNDLLILTFGTISSSVLKVVDKLAVKGIYVQLVTASTLEPLDLEFLGDLVSRHNLILVVEEHISFGGLAYRIRNYLQQVHWRGQFDSQSLPNSFSHVYGKLGDLHEAFGLSESDIERKVLEMLRS